MRLGNKGHFGNRFFIFKLGIRLVTGGLIKESLQGIVRNSVLSSGIGHFLYPVQLQKLLFRIKNRVLHL